MPLKIGEPLILKFDYQLAIDLGEMSSLHDYIFHLFVVGVACFNGVS